MRKVLLIFSVFVSAFANSFAEINVTEQEGKLVISNSYFKIVHDEKTNAGLPCEIICNNKKTSFAWNDGVYHRSGHQIEKGLLASLRLANRPNEGADVKSADCNQLKLVKRTGQEIVVKVSVALSKLTAQPKFVYYFTYSDSPVIGIDVYVSQDKPASWSELRLFDLKFSQPFNNWFCSCPAKLINEKWDRQYAEGSRNRKLRFDKEPAPGHWRIPREHKGQRWVAGIDSGVVFGLLRTWRIITKRGWYDSWPYISNDCKNIRGVWVIPWEGESRRFKCWLYVNRLKDVRIQLNKAYERIVSNLTSVVKGMKKSGIVRRDAGKKKYKIGGFEICIGKGRLEQISYAGKGYLADSCCLFEIEWKLKGGKYVSTVSEEWKTIKTLASANKLILKFGNCKIKQIDSEVTVTFAAEGNKLKSDIVVSPSKLAGIWRVRFPIMKLSPFADYHKLYLPVAMGISVDRPFKRGVDYYCPYPALGATMQWLAVTGKSLYVKKTISLSIYDDRPVIKNFIMHNDSAGKGLMFAIDWSLANMGMTGNKFVSLKPVILQVSKGNWFEAFADYKRWFHTTKFSPVANPKSASRVALWFRSWHGDWGKPYEQIAQQADVPIGMHSCTWFASRHDDYYPQYFPVREGFEKTLARWKKDNWTVVAYINGILHDSESLMFRMLGFKYALRDMDGKMTLPKFNRTVDAYMCVATDYWQRVMKETIIKLVDKVGLDGVYIDMVSGTPALCFDKSHGHPIGGGSWWIEGHRKIVNDCRKILKRKGKEVFFISEYPADCYAGAYNGFLFGTAEWYKDFVPMFQTLIDGKLILYAQEHSYAREPQFWRVVSARELCYGAQIGWFRTEEWKFQDTQTKEFVYKCARWRNKLKDFIEQAEFVPGIRTNAPKVCYFHSRGWFITSDAVMSSCWKKGNKRVIILANVSLQPIKIDVDLQNLYKAKDLLSGMGKNKVMIRNIADNNVRFDLKNIKLAPDEILVFELSS